MLKRLKHRMVSGISSSQWLISTSAQLPIVKKCTRRLWSLKKCTRHETALVPWQGVAVRVTLTPGVSHAARAYCYSLGRPSLGAVPGRGPNGKAGTGGGWCRHGNEVSSGVSPPDAHVCLGACVEYLGDYVCDPWVSGCS